MNEDMTGRRLIIVARVSTGPQVKEGIVRQLEIGREFAKRNGLTVVDEVKLEGKSATLREHVPVLRNLIKRKRKVADFDTLWFLTISRFDRNRDEGDELFKEFEREGVLIVTEKQGTFGGKYGWLKRLMALQEAQAYVEDLAIHCNTGSYRMIREGFLPHCTGFPYGIDRLYLDSHNVPQFVLRKISPWRSDKLNPITKACEGVIEWDGESRKLSFRMPGGKVTLIPGREEYLDVVRRIFRLRYIERYSEARIAGALRPARTASRCRIHAGFESSILASICSAVLR
jgi:DNA invertase Pin-like site-specific DNA recombinase